jgi:MoaA/NifB/PqqE/SkfB family radical SAM enzyme
MGTRPVVIQIEPALYTTRIALQKKSGALMGVNNVVFDIIDRCNLACPSCYHGIHGGTKQVMTIETCRTILDHCAEYFPPKRIWPFNWGEPFMCNDLADFIELFATYPSMELHFSSNMNKGLPDDLIRLVLRHTASITFSVSGLEQSVYEKYHKGGRIEDVTRNIKRFVALRSETGSKTTFIWSLGLNRHNADQVPAIQRFCDENQIFLGAVRYYVTDAQDVFKLLKGLPVKERIFAPLYDSSTQARDEIVSLLTPGKCSLLHSDIVVDTSGNLMLCCATKISTKVHITEVTSIAQVVKARLGDTFCKTCFDEGLVGYFQATR